MEPVRENPLLALSHDLLTGLHATALAPFLREWPRTTERRRIDAAAVPVLRWLAPARRSTPAFSAALMDRLVDLAPTLAWRRSYTAATAGADFYENYGWTEFAGLTGPVPSPQVAIGILLLGPNVTYPPHRHEADEIYVPLAGTAAWQHGDAPWRDEVPGTVIHHPRHQSHAMRTGADPLVALYLWRSANLAQSSQLDAPLPVT